ncbi:MAG: acetate kinase [Pseudomonadales bacterium]|nr:acetate kinase [Pseudomonadales bacterium]RLU04069.1 MAG: acetate kinase [Ketobacter sp.]
MPSGSCLVINTGSSSVKFAVFNTDSNQPFCQGQVTHLFSDSTELTITTQSDKTRQNLAQANHADALEAILTKLNELGILDDVMVIGHRVVHGGPNANQPELISTSTLDLIKQCSEFAPLHNPANLAGIEACQRFNPTLPQIAVFDTAFHSTLNDLSSHYAIPLEWQQQFGIKRFGFHGINHHYIAQTSQRLLPDPAARGVVSAHLGNGCSVCAINDGRSVDTSMGFTPLEGLVMGSRCGDLDPGLLEYLCEKLNTDITDLTQQLNRQSGLQGLSGISGDMRLLLEARDQGNERAALAVELFCYRLAKYIASYVVPLQGIDMLVFTAGIGEHAPAIRSQTVAWLAPLNFELDTTLNQHTQQAIRAISTTGSKPVYVIPANEEWMIAQQCFQLLNRSGEI